MTRNPSLQNAPRCEAFPRVERTVVPVGEETGPNTDPLPHTRATSPSNETSATQGPAPEAAPGPGPPARPAMIPAVHVGFFVDARTRDTIVNFPPPFHERLSMKLKLALTRYPMYLYCMIFSVVFPMDASLRIGYDFYSFPVAVTNSDSNGSMAKAFLESIPDDTIVQRPYSDPDEALASMKRGETWGVLRIGRNFSTSLHCPGLLGNDTDDRPFDIPTVDIDINFINFQVRFMVQKAVFASLIVSSVSFPI